MLSTSFLSGTIIFFTLVTINSNFNVKTITFSFIFKVKYINLKKYWVNPIRRCKTNLEEKQLLLLL